jgi:hypothetical protein
VGSLFGFSATPIATLLGATLLPYSGQPNATLLGATLLLETGLEFGETAQFTGSGSLGATDNLSSLVELAATQNPSLGLILGTVVGVIFIAVIIALIVIFVRRSRATGQLPDTESPAAEMNETEIIETHGINSVITESQGPDTSTTLVFGTYAPADPYHPKEFGYKIPTLPIGFSLWDHEIDEFG